MIKYDLVTSKMIKQVLCCEKTNDPFIKGQQEINCQGIAEQLNDLIHSKCLYCDEGDSSCKCWNDK